MPRITPLYFASIIEEKIKQKFSVKIQRLINLIDHKITLELHSNNQVYACHLLLENFEVYTPNIFQIFFQSHETPEIKNFFSILKTEQDLEQESDKIIESLITLSNLKPIEANLQPPLDATPLDEVGDTQKTITEDSLPKKRRTTATKSPIPSDAN